MSLVLIEGWDSLADVTDIYNYTGAKPTLDTGIKRTGSQSLRCSTHTSKLKIDLPVEGTYIIGFAVYVPVFSSVAYQQPQVNFYRNGGMNVSFHIDASGYIRIYKSFTLLGTSSSQLTNATWHFVEIMATCKNSISADEFIVKIDGLEVLNLAATTDTQNGALSGIDQIVLAGLYNTAVLYYDDVYICDTNGSVNNNFLGDVKVETLYPDGNGNSNQFLGSDANSTDNYLLVDEAQQNEDTDFVEDNTVNNLDLYTFDSMAVTPDSIKGVGVRTYVKKSDVGVRTGKLQCRRSSTTYEGDEFFPASDYLGKDYIWEEDPSTASAWNEAGVNAAEFGIKVHS